MSEAIIKKNGTDYPLLTMPNHYPADRVYLDGDTTKNVQDAVDKQEAMIATVQPNLTAVKAYAKGEQFVYQGLLYKATAAISSGGTITINGNCALADSVTEQIRAESGSFSFQTSGYVNYFRFGKVVMLHIVKNAIPTNEEIGTLPVAFRPSEQLRFRNYAGGGAAIILPTGSIVFINYDSWCNTTCTYTTSL